MKNKYVIEGNILKIFLHRRNGKSDLETVVDSDDFDKLNAYKGTFYAGYRPSIKDYYAQITLYLGTFDGKPKYDIVVMHAIIMGTDHMGRKFDVDHADGKGLNNLKENLRVTNRSDNSKSRMDGPNSNNTSGYRNVCWDKSRNKWIVQLQINGKNTVLGEFKFDELDKAGAFAKEMREKYYKEFKGID